MRFLLLIILLILPLMSLSSDKIERRGMWVVRDALADEKEINKIISTAVSSGISDIFLQIRALGQTYYVSGVERSVKRVSNEFDPLEIMLEKAQRYNIRVHAWVNMLYIWANQEPPLDKDHIFNKYYDFILRKNIFPTYKDIRSVGIEGFYVDPKVKEVQEYLLNLLLEIVAKYDLSGIHLDYYRYPSVEYSFTPTSRTQFILSNYFDPLSLYERSINNMRKRGFETYHQADKMYRNSLIETLSSFLNKVSTYVKRINPHLELSVAVKPNPSEAKLRYFQDWLLWLEEDYCDFVVIMNYRTEWEDFKSILNELDNLSLCPKILVGISTYNQDVNAVKRRINTVKTTNFAGFSLFSYNHFRNDIEYYRNLQLTENHEMKSKL